MLEGNYPSEPRLPLIFTLVLGFVWIVLPSSCYGNRMPGYVWFSIAGLLWGCIICLVYLISYGHLVRKWASQVTKYRAEIESITDECEQRTAVDWTP